MRTEAAIVKQMGTESDDQHDNRGRRSLSERFKEKFFTPVPENEANKTSENG